MYVCVCRNVNEDKIKDALQKGYTYHDLKETFGVTRGCGKCGHHVEQMVEKHKPSVS